MHKFETLYLFGVKSQSGVIWGHRGQILIFTKNALPYVIKYIHVIHTLASHLRDINRETGVDVSKPAGYAICDGNTGQLTLPYSLPIYHQCAAAHVPPPIFKF